eukprot:419352-Pyramimonas_sp.AAC.1
MPEGFAIRSGMIDAVDAATIWPRRLALMQVHAKDTVMRRRVADHWPSLVAGGSHVIGRGFM